MCEPIRVAIVEYDTLVRAGIKSQLNGQDDLLFVGEIRTGEDLFRLLNGAQPDVLILGAHVPQSQQLPLVPLRVMTILKEMAQGYPPIAIILVAQHYFPLADETLSLEQVRGYILRDDFLALEMATAIRVAHRGGTFLSETASQEVFHPIHMAEEYKLEGPQVAILGLIASDPENSAVEHALALAMDYDIYQEHQRQLFRALRVSTRVGAVTRAFQMGILRVEDF